MACPVCDHTMHHVGVTQRCMTYWCPRCGALKEKFGPSEGEHAVSRPRLLNPEEASGPSRRTFYLAGVNVFDHSGRVVDVGDGEIKVVEVRPGDRLVLASKERADD